MPARPRRGGAGPEEPAAVVAVKVIQLDLDERVRKNIMTELRTLIKATCPNIVTIHNAFFVDGHIRIVLEYMNAGSLGDLIASGAGVAEGYIPEILRQVLNGLEHLHRKLRVVHRDVKPSNLLVSRRPGGSANVKLSDFGVSSELTNSVAVCSSWVGTVTYMSPERISGERYSFDADVWSLGLTMLEIATGRFPYSAAGGGGQHPGGGGGAARMGFWDLLDYIVQHPPPIPPKQLFSDEFCDFISACMQKQPDLRPAAETVRAIAALAGPRPRAPAPPLTRSGRPGARRSSCGTRSSRGRATRRSRPSSTSRTSSPRRRARTESGRAAPVDLPLLVSPPRRASPPRQARSEAWWIRVDVCSGRRWS